MEKGYVREARYEDITHLAPNLREADLAEIKATSGRAPHDVLMQGITLGPSEVACLPDGTPVAIYGTAPTGFNPDLGVIWMVATNDFCRLHWQFIRECRDHIGRIASRYKVVYNYTDARNRVHHRWLKWAGFNIIREHPKFGVEGRPFYEFVRLMEK